MLFLRALKKKHVVLKILILSKEAGRRGREGRGRGWCFLIYLMKMYWLSKPRKIYFRPPGPPQGRFIFGLLGRPKEDLFSAPSWEPGPPQGRFIFGVFLGILVSLGQPSGRFIFGAILGGLCRPEEDLFLAPF